MSDSTGLADPRHRRRARLLLRAGAVVLALSLAVVAQRQGELRGEHSHLVRAALAVGGMLLVMSWVTDPLARATTRLVRTVLASRRS